MGIPKVNRVLVDQGSSTEILYYSAFKALNLSQDHLMPADSPLFGFNETPVWPMGWIILPMKAGSRNLQVEFVVVDAPSPYNAILDRTWLHEMKAIASTYHQVVRFIGAEGWQEDIKGDQMTAKKCQVNAVHMKKKTTKGKKKKEPKPRPIEEPEGLVLEDVGLPAEEKAVEDLVTIPINEEGTQYFLLGSTLTEREREQLVVFLKGNIEVFAWTPYEMPGIDSQFISHSLNVDLLRRLVVQKLRRSSPTHSDAVIAEVGRLLDAGAIREVQYPTWLANTVVVPKKNGKLRVCVDYTNLNDACLKDCFPLPLIDQLVDATAGHARLSMMDAYSGYHQIAMAVEDQEKTAFISPRGTYCYKVMPFGLKNAGDIY